MSFYLLNAHSFNGRMLLVFLDLERMDHLEELMRYLPPPSPVL